MDKIERIEGFARRLVDAEVAHDFEHVHRPRMIGNSTPSLHRHLQDLLRYVHRAPTGKTGFAAEVLTFPVDGMLAARNLANSAASPLGFLRAPCRSVLAPGLAPGCWEKPLSTPGAKSAYHLLRFR